jgi:hypothetical protein
LPCKVLTFTSGLFKFTDMNVNTKKATPSQGDAVPAELTFSFEKNNLRTIVMDDQPWFVAKDVCDALGIKDSTTATRSLDEDEKGAQTLRTLGGVQKVAIVNESGLYNLIFRSNKTEAKTFRKWVTAEVLPAIRKHGGYIAPNAQPHSQQPPKGIPMYGTYTEGEPFVSKLGDISTFSIIRNGVQYTQLSKVARHIGYEAGFSRQRINPEYLTAHQLGGAEHYFISLAGIEQMLGFTRFNVPHYKISAIYKDVFGHPAPSTDPYVYKYTAPQMLDIMRELNRKPVRKTIVAEMLFKGGTHV